MQGSYALEIYTIVAVQASIDPKNKMVPRLAQGDRSVSVGAQPSGRLLYISSVSIQIARRSGLLHLYC